MIKRTTLISVLLLMFVVLIACSPQNNLSPEEIQVSALIRVADVHSGGVEPLYGDYSEDLKALIQKSDLIVLGEVVNQYDYSEVSVITEVQVSRHIKGDIGDTVKIIQVKDGYELAIGESYLLVLLSCAPIYDDFYEIRGGVQGAFQQTDNGIEVYVGTFIPEIENYIYTNRKTDFTIDDLADWLKTF